ncbi:YidC/Oxa1 family membrane protein insertase [Thalassoroseus pseudoceratinae]|uniref:YidC/Oxa1 family membrane protein insertase n=1 Tax=Thalassoroseus pseudoceratinae TaxID=2713176 RepID=UPI00141F1E0C|nr:YidC/Oxa1 family membrane protein insertase [Thalassoroseus pseudoceratinae]
MLSYPPTVFAFSIGEPAQQLIEWLESYVNDYGMSVVLGMLIVRLFLLPMTISQRRNSLLIKQLKPELDAIRLEYAGDPQRMRQEQQERLRSVGFNPLAGCVSFLVIGLIFYSFHTAISQIAGFDAKAPFWGQTWIENLKKPDELFDFNFRLPLVGKSFHLLPFIPLAYLLIRNTLIPRDRKPLMQSGLLGALAFGVFLYHLPSADWLLLLTFLSVSEIENFLMPSPPTPMPTKADENDALESHPS